MSLVSFWSVNTPPTWCRGTDVSLRLAGLGLSSLLKLVKWKCFGWLRGTTFTKMPVRWHSYGRSSLHKQHIDQIKPFSKPLSTLTNTLPLSDLLLVVSAGARGCARAPGVSFQRVIHLFPQLLGHHLAEGTVVSS